MIEIYFVIILLIRNFQINFFFIRVYGCMCVYGVFKDINKLLSQIIMVFDEGVTLNKVRNIYCICFLLSDKGLVKGNIYKGLIYSQ